MPHPAYLDTVAPIAMRDPLAELLGTFTEGHVEFSYLEVVKNAGHSCPVVAGAFLTTQAALLALYGDETPTRGEIRVYLPSAADVGVTGVIADVISHITGATATTGFKGLGGRFVRHDLMEFGTDLAGAYARFQRTDTGRQVDVTFDPDRVKGDPRQHDLKSRVMQGLATADECHLFGELSQQRVAKIFAQRDQLITISG